MNPFKKASRAQSKLRMFLMGVSGSGKTMSALRIAKGLGEKVAVIDTEQGSASIYSEIGFDSLSLDTFHPQHYIDAIHAAERAGYDVIVIDSLSPAWSGKEGVLEQVDNAAKRMKSGNSFMAWKEGSKIQQSLIDAILQSKCHVIATMRSKAEYVVEEVNGKKMPRKIGLAPVQRDQIEYEATIVGEMDGAEMVVTKTRWSKLHNAVIKEPGEDLGATLKAWLSDGEPVATVEQSPSPPPNEASAWEERIAKSPTVEDLRKVEVARLKLPDGILKSHLGTKVQSRKRELESGAQQAQEGVR